MLTALKNQHLKMSRCISELAREAGEKPQLGECCESGCASESCLSFTEVVQQVMSNLCLFSFPSGDMAQSCCGQVANSQVCRSLEDLLVPGFGIFRAWITVGSAGRKGWP